MRWLLPLIAACGADPGTDGNNVARTSPLLAGSKSELKIHAPYTIHGADGSPYITTHELAHASLDYLDEYTELGLDDGYHPGAGVILLDRALQHADAFRMWRDEPQRAPRTLVIEVASSAGTPGITIQLIAAVPMFPQEPDGEHGALLLQFGDETQQPNGDLTGIGVQPLARQTAAFTIPEIPNGSASTVVLSSPELDAADYFANGPQPPSRMIVTANRAAEDTLREWMRGPHDVSFECQPPCKSVTLLGAHAIDFDHHHVEIAFVQAQIH